MKVSERFRLNQESTHHQLLHIRNNTLLRDICVHAHVQEEFSLFAVMKKTRISLLSLFSYRLLLLPRLFIFQVCLFVYEIILIESRYSVNRFMSQLKLCKSFTPHRIADINIYRVTSESFTQNPICIGSRVSITFG